MSVELYGSTGTTTWPGRSVLGLVCISYQMAMNSGIPPHTCLHVHWLEFRFRHNFLPRWSLPLFICWKHSYKIILFKKCLFILREREWECVCMRVSRGRGREKEREIERERIPDRLHPHWQQSLMQGSISWAVRPWPEPKPRVGNLTNWTTQLPPKSFFQKFL